MKENEQVLVIPSQVIFERGSWQGIKTNNLDYYLELIKNNSFFKRRGDVEEDESFQQIIPYILFSFENRFFLYRYLNKTTEKRLTDTFQLGVGGHINPIDTGDVLEAGMMREWGEEVNYTGNILEKKLVGVLNDETNPVERVHLGLVYHFIGDSPEISVRETDILKGELVDLKEISEIKKENGVWTSVVWKDYISHLS